MTDTNPAFRCGTVALIGRPNAGKSTLLNRILGAKLAITSSKPQTTRDRIVGVHTTDHSQLILVDTPGLHKAWTELNKAMVRHTESAISDVDVVCWVEDMTVLVPRAQKGQEPSDAAVEAITEMLVRAGRPVILVANKIDVVSKQMLLPVIDALSKRLTLLAVIPMSALQGDGMDALMKEIEAKLPVGPALYPADHWTEQTERFMTAEIIREKIFHLTEQEIPYATAVEIEVFDESERETNHIVKIHAAIIVERDAQKPILIGKGGDMIKRIGTLARKDLVELLDCRVHLELFVKVEPEWTRTEKGLRRVGYNR